MNFVWLLTVFTATKLTPALFRVAVNVAVWMFTFLAAHHAAILTAISYLGTAVLHADSGLMLAAKAGVAYFGTSTVAAFVANIRSDVYPPKPLVDIGEVFHDEWSRLGVAWHKLTSR